MVSWDYVCVLKGEKSVLRTDGNRHSVDLYKQSSGFTSVKEQDLISKAKKRKFKIQDFLNKPMMKNNCLHIMDMQGFRTEGFCPYISLQRTSYDVKCAQLGH